MSFETDVAQILAQLLVMVKERDVFLSKMLRRKRELRLFTYLCILGGIGMFVLTAPVPSAHARGLLQTAAGSPVQFDYSISLGSLLQVGSFLGGLFLFYNRFSERISKDINGMGARITKLEADIAPMAQWWVERMRRLENEHAARGNRSFAADGD